jgi:orotidine-5'-phosphate decarboxylase
VVASPQETTAIRRACGPEFVIVTPGIRGGTARLLAEGASARQARPDDQVRTMTPADAIRAGSSYLVIGRPVTGAPDPRAAARQIADELATLP